ncbi:MAG: arsenite efflux transporter metallochaperone ArsD [Candidatus Rokubacteria bacterium]|nr:arsenite efflux transporter metallochaperone ArsD [Candidatus Rokubacteria bacterium]
MSRIEVFDPPMCCSTGVCGPAVDPALTRFAADVDWLRGQGVAVDRFNLAQQPAAFIGNPVVKRALAESSRTCLPLILVDGEIVFRGAYPSREELTRLAGGERRGASDSAGGRRLLPVTQPASCCGPTDSEGAKKCC